MWSYEVGGHTRTLMRLVVPGARVADPILVEALTVADASLVQAFNDFNPLAPSALPNSSESLVHFLRAVHQLRGHGGGDAAFNLTRISPADAAEFRALARTFEADLYRDLQNWVSVVLQDQGGYRVQSLFAEPPASFASPTWEAMSAAARTEMVQAARCLALECFTACGFHALRSVECMVRDYLLKANEALPKKRDWGQYVTELKGCGAAERVSAIIEDLRRHDRNPLMHPDASFTSADEAIDVLNLSKTALNRIIADMSVRGFTAAAGT